MLTKEKLAEKFRALARIFPGIPSYQEREALRTQDRIIRASMAAALDRQVGIVDGIKRDFTNRAFLEPLAELDRLNRRLQRLADTLRFASYGYAGMFSAVSVDEEKLAELYDYDLALGEDLRQLARAVASLQQSNQQEWRPDLLAGVQKLADRLEEGLAGREALLKG